MPALCAGGLSKPKPDASNENHHPRAVRNWCRPNPDFLWSFVGPPNCMRLSAKKAALSLSTPTNFTGNPGVVDKPRGIPGRCPRNAEVTAGEMEEGVGLRAVSQLRGLIEIARCPDFL